MASHALRCACIVALVLWAAAPARGNPRPCRDQAAVALSPAAPAAPTAELATAGPFSAGLVAGYAWGLVGLAILAGIAGGYAYRHKFGPSWRAPKFDVPVVGIDSDDWGLDFQAPEFVPPGEALDARQAEGVRLVAEVLRGHRDSVGRSPVFNAFVVVRQADTPAIAADPEFAYHARRVDEAMPQTVAALKQAQAEGVFCLAYHSRDHRNTAVWADKVREEVLRCRAEGVAFDPDVVRSFLTDDPNCRDRVIGEYFNNFDGYMLPPDQDEVNADVRDGVEGFEQVFGHRPTNTTAPRYLWGPEAEAALAAAGIRHIHGINVEGGRNRSPHDVAARPFGMRLSHGITGVTRNVEFESSPTTGALPDPTEMLALARQALADGQPIVISTHNWNFASGDADTDRRMAESLDGILTALETAYPNLRYVSAEEIGRLAESGGVSVTVDGKETEEIRAVTGLRHAWRSLRHICRYRAKARLYFRGLAALVGIAVMATAAALFV